MSFDEGNSGQVAFDCPNCSVRNVQRLMLPLADLAADRASEMNVQEDIYINCDDCGLEITLEVIATPFGATADLEGHPSVKVDVVMDAEEPDFDFLETVSDTNQVFLSAVEDVLSHLQNYRPSFFRSVSFYHMLFTRLFSAFEAYLADQLIELATTDRSARGRLLAKAPGISTLQFGLAQIDNNPDLVTQELKRVLRRVSFHDLKRAEGLFEIALGQNVFSSAPQDALKRVSDSVPVRHDCVHRNGKDEDGVMHLQVNEIYVEEMADAFSTLVTHIHRTIKPLDYDEQGNLKKYPF